MPEKVKSFPLKGKKGFPWQGKKHAIGQWPKFCADPDPPSDVLSFHKWVSKNVYSTNEQSFLKNTF